MSSGSITRPTAWQRFLTIMQAFTVIISLFIPAQGYAEEALGATIERFEGQVPGVGFVWAWRVDALDNSSALADAGVEVGDYLQGVQVKTDRDSISAVRHETFDGMLDLLQTAPDNSYLSLDVARPGVGVSKVSLQIGLTPELAGLDTLHLSREHLFQRIYQGQKPDYNDSRYRRLMTHASFHAAYWAVCGKASDQKMHFHMMGAIGGTALIGVREDDYARFVVATQAYPLVSQKIYDDAINNDYSFREVSEIYESSFSEEIAEWQAVLSHYGCSGDVQDSFRKNVLDEIDRLEFSNGARQVVVDFGEDSYEVYLPEAVDINRSMLVGMAELTSRDDQIFTDSYPGQVLRAIAIGNFEHVKVINSAFFDSVVDVAGEVGNVFGIDKDDPVVNVMRHSIELSNTLSKDSGILTAYVLSRTYYLGSCGDPMTSYTQENVSWTEYRNGLGQHISSSPENRSIRQADLPSKFASIIKAQNSIETSRSLTQEMAIIVGKLSCDSPARRQLEDNIIAYFDGMSPRHIGSLPKR